MRALTQRGRGIRGEDVRRKKLRLQRASEPRRRQRRWQPLGSASMQQSSGGPDGEHEVQHTPAGARSRPMRVSKERRRNYVTIVVHVVTVWSDYTFVGDQVSRVVERQRTHEGAPERAVAPASGGQEQIAARRRG